MPIDPSIPLNARPPQPVDPMEQLVKFITLREIMQRNRVNERQIKEDEAVKAELRRTGGDIEKALPGVIQASPQTGLALQSNLVRQATARTEHQKAQIEIELKKMQLQEEALKKLGALAQSVLDAPMFEKPDRYQMALREASAMGLDSKTARLPLAYDPSVDSALASFRDQSLSAQQMIENRRAELTAQIQQDKAKREAELHPLQLDEAAKRNRVLEQQLTGTTPMTEFQKESLKIQKGRINSEQLAAIIANPQSTPEEKKIAQDTLNVITAFENSRAANRAKIDGLVPAQFNRVQMLASQYDAHPKVRTFVDTAEKYATLKSIVDKPQWGGAGDLAMVFEFMKGLDPTSVVREAEFDKAAKAGNVFRGLWAGWDKYFKLEGGFLPPEVRQNFLELVKSKMESNGKVINEMFTDYARRANVITGREDGTQYFTNYTDIIGKLFKESGTGRFGPNPYETAPPAPAGAKPNSNKTTGWSQTQ